MGQVIDYFGKESGDYSFLSNFFWWNGSTVEHEYQAAKTDDLNWKLKILDAKSPKEAKALGQQAPKRIPWDDPNLPIMEQERVIVMRRLLRKKFARGSILAERLLDTGDAELIEGNWWGDTFWGQCKGEGKNMLGKLLMERREELRHGVFAG